MTAKRERITGLRVEVLGFTLFRIRYDDSIENRERYISWIFLGIQGAPSTIYPGISAPCFPRFPCANSTTTAIVRWSAGFPRMVYSSNRARLPFRSGFIARLCFCTGRMNGTLTVVRDAITFRA
ncbi:MAG TPA: hypothetical protein PK089_02335 [Methanoregulaceae archaeon]|mgnify:CR=1 FL=1|nr:hypothetical protein [Methanoregulaceae archaeon]HQJ87200.1 hypothetical protein [Methanoregulaceae archaeon]